MGRLSVVELKQSISDVLDRAERRGERTIVQRRGKDAAAIIAIEDLKLLEQLVREQEDRVDTEAALAARAESDELIPYEQVRQELGLTDASKARTVSRRPDQSRAEKPRKAPKKGPAADRRQDPKPGR